eukprot:9211332-Alexandrium_andersonii.AAC.1
MGFATAATPARHTAMETARMALAPRDDLDLTRSRLPDWSGGSRPQMVNSPLRRQFMDKSQWTKACSAPYATLLSASSAL